MLFRQLFHAESGTYTYLLADEVTRQALLIDPVIDNVEQYVQLLSQLNLKLAVAIDTHVHADHITALGALRDLTGCASMMGEPARASCVSGTFRNGDLIRFGNLSVQALFTPGHTDDSYTFLYQDGLRLWAFTGDSLLIRGCGRTDFQNGDARRQYDSLYHKLLALPDDTLVYPAHDYKGWTLSTIGEERHHNPRLQEANVDGFVTLMANLKLPNPKRMDVAVPANLACGKGPSA
jgi:glyoxylase-like metal-dependent hydrolase (beta-lactamase superfamily II)